MITTSILVMLYPLSAAVAYLGGKKCPKCKQRIFHDKWNIQPKLAEDRWAHQEARKREIAEVADFLGV